MPWKRCPDCHEHSYSADEERDTWPCPACGRELAPLPVAVAPRLVVRSALAPERDAGSLSATAARPLALVRNGQLWAGRA